MDKRVLEIKDETFQSIRTAQRVWVIEGCEGGFMVHQWTHDGVAPPSVYPALRQAAARLLQLLRTGAVAPQTWPEEICIGYVDIDA